MIWVFTIQSKDSICHNNIWFRQYNATFQYLTHPSISYRQRAIRPLCNLSFDDAFELMDLVERHVDWEAVRQELEEFSAINGQGRELRWEDFGE